MIGIEPAFFDIGIVGLVRMDDVYREIGKSVAAHGLAMVQTWRGHFSFSSLFYRYSPPQQRP
ncbi:hypothetical protein [Sphingomonas sp. C3-2]|uniref:hypothetical protein n=1 Tax=Sphingomonas sp. C3-2 TaxID=3062169 RepID=UPI00294AD4D4|nr:hypothetical protein [Sphingomonas sp. C3-2]WOK36447.1 hypothetical protein QYC26_15815 [Sphingomonas sp. C3-2]